MPPITTGNQVIGLFKELASLWRTYLERRTEAYELHLKKRRLNALKIADRMDETVREIFNFVSQRIAINDKQWDEYYKLRKKYLALDKKFDKLD